METDGLSAREAGTPGSELLFRRAVLSQLEAAYPASLSLETLSLGLEACGFAKGGKNALEPALEYLREKGYAQIVRSRISAAHKRAKLTAEGLDYLESGEW